MKRMIVVLCLLLVVISLFLGCLTGEVRRVRRTEINEVGLESVLDGKYIGSFKYGGFTYEVEVTIKNNAYTDINILKNRTSKYAKKAEAVVPRVIAKQSLRVDTISGATTTSKALLKAIENAFNKN